MTKQKPVWRMNTGNGVPSDYEFKILYASGKVSGSHDADFGIDLYWTIDSNDSYQEPSDIYAYQTNRTKAAKFERVKCDACYGYSEIIYEYCSAIRKHQATETCRECNGTGRMARRITC